MHVIAYRHKHLDMHCVVFIACGRFGFGHLGDTLKLNIQGVVFVQTATSASPSG